MGRVPVSRFFVDELKLVVFELSKSLSSDPAGFDDERAMAAFELMCKDRFDTEASIDLECGRNDVRRTAITQWIEALRDGVPDFEPVDDFAQLLSAAPRIDQSQDVEAWIAEACDNIEDRLNRVRQHAGVLGGAAEVERAAAALLSTLTCS